MGHSLGVSNTADLGDSLTLTLRPSGHPGFTFEPGQFAWLSTGKTPFSRDRHPISMSSAAADELGRALSQQGRVVPALPVGSRVWVDGPYGVFTADREQGPGYVLIGGGAGIAPLFSICQTLIARGNRRLDGPERAATSLRKCCSATWPFNTGASSTSSAARMRWWRRWNTSFPPSEFRPLTFKPKDLSWYRREDIAMRQSTVDRLVCLLTAMILVACALFALATSTAGTGGE